jgi:hypothetical protein
MTAKEKEKQSAREMLRELLKPGDKVQTILRHVSRSGMMRHISMRIPDRDITYLAAKAMNDKLTHNGPVAIKVKGCGMDMGFALVYELGAVLWPKGTSEPHGTRNGKPDYDGGYALNHEWL